MKKLVSCLLVVMMLFAATTAFAWPSGEGRFGSSDIVSRFVKETDTQTKDIALQAQAGNQTADLVIRIDGKNLHLVSRNNGVEDSHVQLNPTGIYVGSAGSVSLLRYATVTTVMQNIVNGVDALLEQAMKSIPEEELPSKTEIKNALKKLSIVASAVEAQEQADAATLSSAAVAFADKFKPEYILDVKGDEGSVEINLRSDAFATALAEAMDELMVNPALAELVDRNAALSGDATFADAQQAWLANREATLEAIRSTASTVTMDENGHFTYHFQIGEAESATKIMVFDADAWIDVENGALQTTSALGFENESPLMVYELTLNRYAYQEKLTSGESLVEASAEFEEGLINGGKISVVIEGNEELWADFGPDYLYMKGPKGGISTTVRETLTGKIRYELVAETIDGKEESVIVDFYQEDDSLICELNASGSEQPAFFKLSRIDKVNIDDLSAANNIDEITVDKVNAELENILKKVIKTGK